MTKPTTQRSATEAHERDQSRDLRSTYALLTDDGSVSLLPISETFWPEVLRGEHPELEHGRLVSCFEFSQNWVSWERHPAGDELVILVRGRAHLLLEQSDRVERVSLTEAGQFVSIPRATWHTLHPEGPCTMLFITAGRGTEHRPA